MGLDGPRWVAWEAVLCALVESKASAIKAEYSAKRERRKSRAWRLLSHRRADPITPASPVTAHGSLHHNHHHHHHHHHHPLHHHHHLPPITLHGDTPSPRTKDSSTSSEVTINAGMLQPPTGPPPRSSFSSALTASHMCTTSDAPALPSDETVTTLSPDPDPDPDSVAVHIGDLPQDHPPPLRRTRSSNSHQGYHNYDYSVQHPTARRVTSWSCSASPGHAQVAQPALVVQEKYVSLSVPDEDVGALLLGNAPKRPRRKKRRRRARGAAAGASRGRPGRPGQVARVARLGQTPMDKAHRLTVDPDDLPKRARWTIVVTACLLLVMSMLLVGVTLRMAPIIDEMVRKENEEHMNMLNRANLGLINASAIHGHGGLGRGT